MIETVRRLTDIPWLIHGFTTRHGGVSAPPHASLNLGYSRPDDPAAVLENRRRAAAEIGFELSDAVLGGQVHGTTVTRVTAADRGRGSVDRTTIIPASDGLICAEPGVILWANVADCVPLLLVDPVHRAVGVVHAGWQGTADDIGGAAVAAMQAEFQSSPAELLAVIGPSIGPCCYEVAEPLIGRFEATFGAAAPDVLLHVPGKERAHCDLWRANRLLLQRAGLHDERIIATELCTACHVERFFSHRREQGATGRFAALIGIRRADDPLLAAHC